MAARLLRGGGRCVCAKNLRCGLAVLFYGGMVPMGWSLVNKMKMLSNGLKKASRAGFMALILATAFACPGLDYDLNDAVLSITPEGETELTLTHDPGLSEVRVTPPVDQSFTATFSNLDPVAELSIAIEDAAALAEQTDLEMPLDASLAVLNVRFEDRDYRADSSQAQGYLTIERLELSEDSVSFRASFQGSLLDDSGNKAAVNGYLDAIYAPAQP